MTLNISPFIKRLFPHTCLLCGMSARAERLCDGCRDDLPHHTVPQCPQCAIPTPAGQLCGACLKRPPAYERCVAAFSYSFPVDQLIPALKYHSRLAIAQVLGQHLAEAVATCPRPDLLIPMPLHPARIQQRGFNHATEIGRVVARALNVPLDFESCKRVRDTPPQVALAYDQRRRNVRGAFVCEGDVNGKRIALIDDVITTGTSLDELAKTLKKAGAAEVETWVVARTLRRDDQG
jgi:ComF family protein